MALREVADADADDREVVFVVVVSPQGLAGGLRDAIEVARSGEFGAVEEVVVVLAVQVGRALVGLVVANGVVRRGEDDLLDAGVDGGLEDRLGAVDIVCQDAVPRRFGARIARQVNHDIDSVHRLADGVLVGDIRNDELARLVVRRGIAIQ